MLPEQTPLTVLKGVGPSIAGRLGTLHLNSVQDLLFHLPLRYQDRTRISPIASGRSGTETQVEGEVLATEVAFGRRRRLLCRSKDQSGIISLRFVHFSAAQKNALQPGTKLRCYGEVRGGKTGLELYHPEYQFLNPTQPQALAATLTPIYPSTEGLQQTRLRGLIGQALELLDTQLVLKDWLPESMRNSLGFHPLNESIRYLHRPPVGETLYSNLQALALGQHPSQRRLAFEELLSHRLCLRRLRAQAEQLQAPALHPSGKLRTAFLNRLPFRLTKAQTRVSTEITKDLAQGSPMLRLLQGDVGSGKTIVAALAALQAVENGYQAAVMAPTEILAEQHFLNFSQWLEPLGLTRRLAQRQG